MLKIICGDKSLLSMQRIPFEVFGQRDLSHLSHFVSEEIRVKRKMDIIETTYYLKLSEFGKSFFEGIVINDVHKRCLDQSYVEMESHF